MVKLVENHEELKKKTGRPSKLSLENQVLMTLKYLPEQANLLSEGVILGRGIQACRETRQDSPLSPRDVLTARITLGNLGG